MSGRDGDGRGVGGTAGFARDREQLRRQFGRAAAGYDDGAVLQREVLRRMLERLDLIRLAPTLLLDVGCATGAGAQALQARYPQAQVLAIDFAPPMLRQLARRAPARRFWRGRRPRPLALGADAARLPLADASCQLVFSNLMLHWHDDPAELFREMHRVLAPGGLLLFSTLGPDTLTELRRSWRAADPDYPHVQAFIDMHDLGDALLRERFADPVMDVEHLTLTYRRSDELVADLRGAGAVNACRGRRRGCTGRARWRTAREHYERFRDPASGLLPATFEVVHGHAWAAPAHKRQRDRDPVGARPDGAVPVSLARLRRGGPASDG